MNFLSIHNLSAATSGGFLVVYAAVNVAAIRLRKETGTAPWMPALAFLLCVAALVIMVSEFLSSPADGAFGSRGAGDRGDFGGRRAALPNDPLGKAPNGLASAQALISPAEASLDP